MGLGISGFKYVFEPIADDPLFKELLQKMNLVPWEADCGALRKFGVDIMGCERLF